MKMHAHIRTLVTAFVCLLALDAAGQTVTRIKGGFSGNTATDTNAATFSCTGADPCIGSYSLTTKYIGCNSPYRLVDDFVITGLKLAVPGPIAADFRFVRAEFEDNINGGNCVIRPETIRDAVIPFTGTWDGTRGTISATIPTDDMGGMVTLNGSFTADKIDPPFPMTVSARFEGGLAKVDANIQFRAQDQGTNGRVFAFAVAPVTIVKAAVLKSGETLLPPLGYAKRTDGAKEDTSVACVLAQLNTAGQLQQVSASSMQAYVSGVLGSQGQAIAVVNGVATTAIGGTTFYVGYGASAQSMLGNGLNRNVATVPGALECKPGPPQTGWWWNPAEGGRGYSLEVNGNHIFWAGYLYDVTGRSDWYIAAGSTSIDGSLFTGDLLHFAGGQSLGGAYKAPAGATTVGSVTLAFTDAQHGTMVWPGGPIGIERMNIVPNGLTAPPQDNIPESGWWWNPEESGRGFFIEWQNGWVDMAGFMYDDSGNAVWYLNSVPTPDARSIASNWWQFANGQSLLGAYKPPIQVSDHVAPFTIQFSSTTTATMTLPNGRTTSLQRQKF
ncbi:hypothetical protein BWI17_20875 [Betaproteobacteria bacterium GR16-43]|nr:hypothetical protein BWI17_20875 [Betaproteobacteria bacterium GR16-43]